MSELSSKDSKYRPYLDKVLKALNDNKGKGYKLKLPAQTFEDLRKITHTLNTQAQYLGGAYAELRFVAKPSADNKGKAFAAFSKDLGQNKQGKSNKAKGGKPKAKKQALQSTTQPETQEVSLEDLQNILKDIRDGRMPDAILPTTLNQMQILAAKKQAKLDAPDTKDDEKESIRKYLQYVQLIIEAIKKKLGQ
jgi:hypothetical protein